MTGAATRGQPLLVFSVILGAWLVGRVVLWESPFPAIVSVPHRILAESDLLPVVGPARSNTPTTAQPRQAQGTAAGPVHPPLFTAPLPATAQWMPLPASVAPSAVFAPVPARNAAGHNMLLAVASAHMALSPEIAAFYAERGRSFAAVPAADRPLLETGQAGVASSRWSGDGWLLWRDGSGQSVAPGVASYGRSQAGGVLRYRLAAGGVRPEAFARITHTLEGPRQAELAGGISVRPVAALPLRFAAEARVTDTAERREVRPAAFAVTELPPVRLPHGLRAEGYAQAGWVGGDFATGFVDGQARVDGRVARLGTADEELRAGLGAWGGAQKGAARLDFGPSAAIALKIGEVRSRLAVDYRIRVAGEAAPASGPALTFSAGF